MSGAVEGGRSGSDFFTSPGAVYITGRVTRANSGQV
jgi:hypothetical protein